MNQGADRSMKVAVVGSGVAGVVTSHILHRKHQVFLYERADRIGGHTNTVVIEDGPDAGTCVDTGFIVFNDRTYPLFQKFLSRLGVPWRDSDMSFGFHCERSGLQYSGTSLNGLFAQRRNLLKPAFYWMLADMRRFHKEAARDLADGSLEGQTLRQYLRSCKHTRIFVDNYLVPMGAAIWSTPPGKMLDFPAETLARFFQNHGLLSFTDYPQWRTVVGGSHTYLKSFRQDFTGEIITNARIRSISRPEIGPVIRFEDGEEQHFDWVVIATHADQALRLLEDPTPEETRLLGAWSYERNHTILHTDESVLPPNRRAWASWNYTAEDTGEDHPKLSVTYHMNRLQGLRTRRQYCVSLNRAKPVRQGSLLREFDYEHPLYTFEAIQSQRRLPHLNGPQQTCFAGSYFGYGFHEDAVRSAVHACRHLGVEL